jgi:hypothetical protein
MYIYIYTEIVGICIPLDPVSTNNVNSVVGSVAGSFAVK